MSNHTMTREEAERRLFVLASTVTEEPRRGGVARLLERGARALLEETRAQKAVEDALEVLRA